MIEEPMIQISMEKHKINILIEFGHFVCLANFNVRFNCLRFPSARGHYLLCSAAYHGGCCCCADAKGVSIIFPVIDLKGTKRLFKNRRKLDAC